MTLAPTLPSAQLHGRVARPFVGALTGGACAQGVGGVKGAAQVTHAAPASEGSTAAKQPWCSKTPIALENAAIDRGR